MIVVIDYGLGNLGSVKKAVERAGYECVISFEAKSIQSAEKLILPGVGHFKVGMDNLRQRGLITILEEEVITRQKPILGICLGMQLMTSFSEEGNVSGLDWVGGTTRKFPFSGELRIPHMGWNTLNYVNPSAIYDGLTEESFFYFVHSYFVSEIDTGWISAETVYGINFVSSFAKQNIFGCQFHPEKSHTDGLHLLKNFCAL